MKDILEYKGFAGSVHFSTEDDTFFGRIEGVIDLVTFEGRTVEELRQSFKQAVDDYLELCKQANKRPQKSYRGSFNIRISPELHQKAVETAVKSGQSLNQLVQRAIEREVTSTQQVRPEERGTQHVVSADAPRTGRGVGEARGRRPGGSGAKSGRSRS